MSKILNETTEEDARTIDLATRDRHGLLMAERRRLALEILAGDSGSVDLEELAAGVATREEGPDADEETIERVAVALHHNHLPKMADLGVLAYDRDAHRIEPTGVPVDFVQ